MKKSFLFIFSLLALSAKPQCLGSFDLPDYYCSDNGNLFLLDYVMNAAAGGIFTGAGVSGNNLVLNISNPNPITITYSDPTGCVYTDDINVYFNCCHTIPPNVSIQLPEKLCQFESLLDLSNYVSVPGGTFYGNGVTGIFFDPSVSPASLPDHVITITYELFNGTNNCFDYVHDVIVIDKDCCNDPASPYVVPSFGGTATGLGLTDFTNLDVTILGNFYIDQNFTIDNSLVRFDDQVVMTVQSGKTLTITNSSDLFSCYQEAWNGIRLEPGAHIIVDGNSIIQDAERAIHAIDDASVFISDCIFNKNVVGVLVAYNGGQTTAYPISIGGNVGFTGSSSVNSPGTVLDINNSQKQQGHIGIQAIRINNLAVGNVSQQFNYFDNLEYGILADETDLRIYNNSFTNIRGPEADNFSTSELYYYAIYASNIKTSHLAFIGDSFLGDFTTGNNVFINCVKGIYLENYERTSIINNYFDAPVITTPPSNRNGEAAITTANDFATPFFNMAVNDNTIKEFAGGIRTQFVLNNVFTNNFLSIRNNDIIRTSVRPLTQGISLTSVIPSNLNGFGNNWNISDNKIINCRNGIKVSGIRAADLIIDNNEIEMTGGAPLLTVRYGILLENSYRTNIINNLVKGANGFALNTLNKGIKVAFSNTTLVSCNDIRRMGQSLVFEGVAVGTVTGNKIQRAFDGFVLLNNGTIGQQGDVNNPIDNKWIGPFFNSHTLVHNTSTANIDSPLWLRNTGPFWPTNNQLFLSPLGSEYTSGTGLNIATGPMIQCPALPLGVKIREDLAKAHQNYLDFELSTKWIGKHTVFSELQADSSLRAQSIVLDSFYLASQNTCFDEVNKIIDAVTLLDTSLLGTLVNNFVPACNIEQNYKDFYSILYNYWITDSVSSSEKAAIENIAWQCPIIGGTVVYSARNFFDYLNNFTTEFEDNCDSEFKSFYPNFSQDKTENEISVYPNPNNGEFTIELKEKRSGKILIYDISGKIIHNENVNSDKTICQLTDILPGLYIIEFTNDDTLVRTKFTVK